MPSVTAESSGSWGVLEELAECAGRQQWCHWITSWEFATGLDKQILVILKYVHFPQDSTEQPFDSWHKGYAVPSSTFSSGRQPWGWCPSNPSSTTCHSGKSILINIFEIKPEALSRDRAAVLYTPQLFAVQNLPGFSVVHAWTLWINKHVTNNKVLVEMHALHSQRNSFRLISFWLQHLCCSKPPAKFLCPGKHGTPPGPGRAWKRWLQPTFMPGG